MTPIDLTAIRARLASLHRPDHNGDAAERRGQIIMRDVPDLLELLEMQTRALLEVEWGGGRQARPGYGLGVYTIEDPADPCCPACGAERGIGLPDDQKHGSTYTRLIRPDLACALDAALTAAGFDTQAKRDAKRDEIDRTR